MKFALPRFLKAKLPAFLHGKVSALISAENKRSRAPSNCRLEIFRKIKKRPREIKSFRAPALKNFADGYESKYPADLKIRSPSEPRLPPSRAPQTPDRIPPPWAPWARPPLCAWKCPLAECLCATSKPRRRPILPWAQPAP